MESPDHPTDESCRPPRSRRRLVLALALIMTIGAAAALFFGGGGSGSEEGRPVPAPNYDPFSSSTSGEAKAQPGDLVITLSEEKIENARFRTELASEIGSESLPVAAGKRTTGSVQSNAYKEVPVIAVVGGIVKQVSAELGDAVHRGQAVATIFSTELADAQATYLKALAEMNRHHQHHKRTVELVEIGAVSREELEGATAEYKMAEAAVASARQRLILLGMTEAEAHKLNSADRVRSMMQVNAPSRGTVINRSANPGQVVAGGDELLRLADLSSVWVIAQIYENDLSSVRLGTRATITTPAYPGRMFNGRVSYIAPAVDPQTRTAQVRVELPNTDKSLKLNMFVDVSFPSDLPPTRNVTAVPKSAVQNIGGRQYVFIVTGQPGVFIQREVSVGPEMNSVMPVYRGVVPGDRVVTEGSFLLRAESLKVNPNQVTQISEAQRHENSDNGTSVQSGRIVLTETGYQPASITLRKGVPARLTFVREVEATCGTEIVIPDYGVRRELPLNEPVVVEITPTKSGEFEFTCGMSMLRGRVLVK